MPANVQPIFSKLSDFQGGPLINTAASVVYDISGTIGTDIYKLFQADATNGGFLQKIRFKYAANGTTTSVAALIRLWIASVSIGTPTIGSQAWFFDEISVPATGALSVTAPTQIYEVPFNLALPPGYTVLAKITANQSANTGWLASAIAGKY